MNYFFEKNDDFKIGSLQIEFWRMNMMAISSKHNFLFIASQNNIFSFILQNDGKIQDFEHPKVYQINLNDVLINQICVKTFQDKDYLMTVDMDAKVAIFDISNMDNSLYEFDNKYQEIADNSTWSLDLFADSTKILAGCGANNRKISMWDISNAGNPSPRISIDAHSNNIPCVKFSPCGQFIASTSIDCKVKIFLVSTGQEICYSDLTDWGWSALWIEKKTILSYGKYKFLQKKDKKSGNFKFIKGTINYQLNKYLLFVTENSKMKLIDPMGRINVEIKLDSTPFQMKEIHSVSKFLNNHTSFKFDSLKTDFIFPGLILGMDFQEIKGANPSLDVCKLYTVCKEKMVSQVDITKDYKIVFPMMNSFL